MHRSRAPLKARLMDQKAVSGVGNLLADEILWRAGWTPARRADETEELIAGCCRGGVVPRRARRSAAAGAHGRRDRSTPRAPLPCAARRRDAARHVGGWIDLLVSGGAAR